MTYPSAYTALATLALCACGGPSGPSGPTYQFGPTRAPLRYEIREHGNFSIETPMGEQHSIDSTRATVVIEIGSASDGGHAVTVTFEALDLWDVGDFSSQHAEGGDLLGAPFIGRLSPGGLISVTTTPEIPEKIASLVEPREMIADLLPPLPPAGALTEGSWPHNRVARVDLVMSTETRYEGMARFAGDTIWNGIEAKVIVSNGTISTFASGTPPGAPGVVKMTQTGTSRTIYIWDAQRGVMLASRATIDAEGGVDVVQMDTTMPSSYSGVREVRLRQ